MTGRGEGKFYGDFSPPLPVTSQTLQATLPSKTNTYQLGASLECWGREEGVIHNETTYHGQNVKRIEEILPIESVIRHKRRWLLN